MGTSKQAGSVSVLLTGDVDFSTHHHPADKLRALGQLGPIGKDLGGGLTLFFVAREAQQVPDVPSQLRAAGNEIGCHGLTHGDEEEYDVMPVEKQETYLSQATSILEGIAGDRMRAFRGPRVKISGLTLSILSKMGYFTDSTVCSQRLDLISSNLYHAGWLRAPRLPYHPCSEDAYARGGLSILEVPVSAAVIPFISSTMYVFGLSFMKLFFRALYVEARRTGKPIVYLFHPYEFATEIPGAKSYKRNVRVHGLRLRRYLYRGTAEQRFSWNCELWRYMASFDKVRFQTMTSYAAGRAG